LGNLYAKRRKASGIFTKSGNQATGLRGSMLYRVRIFSKFEDVESDLELADMGLAGKRSQVS